MATFEDLQKRMAAIFADAKYAEIKIQDTFPHELQTHFMGLEDLKAAREYIKEADEREKELVECNDNLEKELRKAKEAVEELPEDHHGRLIDLQQALHHVEFYKKLMQEAEDRATNHEQRWKEAIRKQTVVEEFLAKHQRLRAENDEYKSVIMRLVNENRDMQGIFERLRAQDMKALEDKETKLMDMEKFCKAAEKQYNTLDDENEKLEQTYTSLVQSLDNETINAAEAVNSAAERARKAEQLRIATVSEMAPLKRSYDRCSDVLLIFQDVFKQLLNTTRQDAVDLPDTLRLNLNFGAKECEKFRIMRDAMYYEDIEMDEVRSELTGLARSSTNVLESLAIIAMDLEHFLQTLERRPDTWQLLRMKFGNRVIKQATPEM